jgi:hypothetical protein
MTGELPSMYSLTVMNGQEALQLPGFTDKLDDAWIASYLQSTEPAQSEDEKYLPESKTKRMEQITKELSQEGAIIVSITYKDKIVGFFWGLPFPAFQKVDPKKSKIIIETVGASNNNPHFKWKHTAYLSMMGVVHKRENVKHTGKGFGKLLTSTLNNAFQQQSIHHVVARTINPLAWDKVYKEDFVLFGAYQDESVPSNPTRYIFGKTL